eukprot:CAMPEP_0174716976 /NCGR_PEP_ID=MMETSP1094-20130205/25495_1 /TAXON_ID=156173 /ORGANISM="Chrysochromulina brevifilum, Strain UTEX LB 985" /LENGTH=79 /DNA_ID=CAMNT_0015916849 /DNA_START=327 /DNA_END=563 /DNA_ORIENTATION=+
MSTPIGAEAACTVGANPPHSDAYTSCTASAVAPEPCILGHCTPGHWTSGPWAPGSCHTTLSSPQLAPSQPSCTPGPCTP